MRNRRLWKKFSSVKTGAKLLKALRDRREKTEAGNCMASGPMILSLPDMCTSPIDTCGNMSMKQLQCLCVISLSLLLHFSLCLTDDRRQMTGMNGERKEGPLQGVAPDYIYMFP